MIKHDTSSITLYMSTYKTSSNYTISRSTNDIDIIYRYVIPYTNKNTTHTIHIDACTQRTHIMINIFTL